ncbi:MAG: hypothetical protein ACI9MR_004602 [Myxococcota bacterium]|jgi:hypothetical protein
MSHTAEEVDKTVLTHLSALVDGELEPLEAIAVQRHVRGSETLVVEVRELEHVKLAVHLAGIRDSVPANVGARLRQHCGELAETKRAGSRARRWVAPLASAALAASAILAAVVLWPAAEAAPTMVAVAPPVVELSDVPWASPEAPFEVSEGTLLRFVSLHRGDLRPSDLPSARSGALLSVDTIPRSFIRPEGESNLVLASFEACQERPRGATLARLRADRVVLPDSIRDALESSGVYSDVIEGVEVKLNLNGDTLLVKVMDANAFDEPI